MCCLFENGGLQWFCENALPDSKYLSTSRNSLSSSRNGPLVWCNTVYSYRSFSSSLMYTEKLEEVMKTEKSCMKEELISYKGKECLLVETLKMWLAHMLHWNALRNAAPLLVVLPSQVCVYVCVALMWAVHSNSKWVFVPLHSAMIAEVPCTAVNMWDLLWSSITMRFQPDKWDHSLGSKGCDGQGMSHELVQGSFKQDPAMCFSQWL